MELEVLEASNKSYKRESILMKSTGRYRFHSNISETFHWKHFSNSLYHCENLQRNIVARPESGSDFSLHRCEAWRFIANSALAGASQQSSLGFIRKTEPATFHHHARVQCLADVAQSEPFNAPRRVDFWDGADKCEMKDQFKRCRLTINYSVILILSG
jgi:hypothetical protein